MHVKARDQLQWLASISLQFRLSTHIFVLGLSVWVCVHARLPVFACRGQKKALGVLLYHFLTTALLGGRVSLWTWGFHFLGRLARSQHAPAASCLGILRIHAACPTGAGIRVSVFVPPQQTSYQVSHIFSPQFSFFRYLIRKKNVSRAQIDAMFSVFMSSVASLCKHCGGSFQEDFCSFIYVILTPWVS